MAREQSSEIARSFFTVAAASHGTTAEEKAKKKTHVKVVSATNTLAGPGIKAMKLGQTQEFDLSYGQVLNVETDTNGSDPTGSYIEADLPVAVFAGSQAAYAPNTDHCIGGKCEFQGWVCKTNDDCPTTCCANHMEEQLLPTELWGVEYVATHFAPRGKAKDVYRILAQFNNTAVTTTPPQTGTPLELQQGEWVEIESDQDFVIQSNPGHSIEVGQYMAGASAPDPNNDTCTGKFAGQKVCSWFWNVKQIPLGCNKNADCPNIPEGDDAKTGAPSFVILPPVERFQAKYVFYVPQGYFADYINVVVKVAEISLDGVDMAASDFNPIGAGWSVARVPISPGQHVLTANSPIGLIAYGWADDVSYSYAGGAEK